MSTTLRPIVLVAEDDRTLRELLLRGLTEEGFEVAGVGTGAALISRAGEAEVLVVDVSLPDADGRDICQALRARGLRTPVLFLTARDALTDRLAGFHAGGDDYVTKPFALDEVVVRLWALLRRAGTSQSVDLGAVELDPVAHAVRSGEATVALTPTEFRLLAALAATPGVPVRRRELVRSAWPHEAIVHDNTLDVYAARLRRKLSQLTNAPRIETVRGVGYRLK